MGEVRALIWTQCIAAGVGVSLAYCDAIRYHPPLVTWLFGSPLGQLLCVGVFWVGVGVPAAILVAGIRGRLPARRWLPVLVLSLFLAALQMAAMTQLIS